MFKSMMRSLREPLVWLREMSGQGLVEYAMLLMLVAMVVFVLIITFGGSVGQLFSNIVRAI